MKALLFFAIPLVISCTSAESKKKEKEKVEQQKLEAYNRYIDRQLQAYASSNSAISLDTLTMGGKSKYTYQLQESLKRNNRIVFHYFDVSDIFTRRDSTYVTLKVDDLDGNIYIVNVSVTPSRVSQIAEFSQENDSHFLLCRIEGVKKTVFDVNTRSDGEYSYYNTLETSNTFLLSGELLEVKKVPAFSQSH